MSPYEEGRNKMEKKGIKKKKIWVLLGIVLILLFCTFFFRVKKVTIQGNTYYSQEDMVEMFQSNIFHRNVLTFWLMNKCSLTPKLDFVREYEVSYPNVNEIAIKLYEKKIVAGIAYSNQYIYFDKDGMVLRSEKNPIKDIPLFETKNLTTFSLYKKVQMEDEELLEQIMNLANLFQHYKVKWDRVEFDEFDNATINIKKIRVLLGKKKNYDEEISALASVLENNSHKENQEGTFDLRNYKVGGDIILKRNQKPSVKKAKQKPIEI